jgi:uncharacterized protein GlcG (DUF336 family)
MRFLPILLLTALAVPGSAFTQTGQPGLDIAREAATAAVVACEHLGFRTMATVVDGSGRPVAAMAAEPRLARRLANDSVHSAQIAAYFHDRSSNIAERITEEASVFYAIRDHPRLAPLEAGGVPFPGPDTLEAIGVSGPANGDGLRAIGVAGASDGDKDEECARDGVIDVVAKLK